MAAKKPKKRTAKKRTAKKRTAKKTTAKKTTAKKKVVAKKAVAKKVVAKKATPKKKVVAKKATPKKAAPKKKVAAPRKAAKTKAAKTKAPAVDAALLAQRRAHLEAQKLPDLKAMLRTNDQVTTGTKRELVDRVLDRVTHGNLPRCPQCHLGRLRFEAGSFTCPGGYDDDEYMACTFVAQPGEVERPAWQFSTAGLA